VTLGSPILVRTMFLPADFQEYTSGLQEGRVESHSLFPRKGTLTAYRANEQEGEGEGEREDLTGTEPLVENHRRDPLPRIQEVVPPLDLVPHANRTDIIMAAPPFLTAQVSCRHWA
jgi:hypothetical protein